MSNGNLGTCRKCGRRVIWIRTKAGNNMPCDLEILPYQIPRTKTCTQHFVTEVGEVVAAERSTGARIDGYGYNPHCGTCKGNKR